MARGDKPRGRMTAYACFVQTCREQHKRSRPDDKVDFAEFSKQCAEAWKTMNDAEKQRFHLQAAEDKKRYDAEMSTYVPKEDPRGKNGRRKKLAAKKKDPNAPKKALTAFFHFCQEERGGVKAALGDVSVAEVAKELGRRWKACTAEQKARYEALAAADKQRYESAMSAYKQEGVSHPGQAAGFNMNDDEDDY